MFLQASDDRSGENTLRVNDVVMLLCCYIGVAKSVTETHADVSEVINR